MTHQEFKKLVRARQKHTVDTLLLKGAEYSRDNDRLHNFTRAAAMNDQTPAQALWGMASKHLISIKDMVDDTADDIYPTEDQIEEKIGDVINYFHLLEGVFLAGKQTK